MTGGCSIKAMIRAFPAHRGYRGGSTPYTCLMRGAQSSLGAYVARNGLNLSLGSFVKRTRAFLGRNRGRCYRRLFLLRSCHHRESGKPSAPEPPAHSPFRLMRSSDGITLQVGATRAATTRCVE